MRFNFEIKVTNKILNLVKLNTKYLTLSENLPQLAKLLFSFDFLYQVGRLCYGYQGIIQKYGYCEDNFLDKVECCYSGDLEKDNLIYGAFGIHITNKIEILPMSDFYKILFGSSLLSLQFSSVLETKELKKNKTWEEWEEIFLLKDYNFIGSEKRRIADHILCTIGTGYEYKDGFIYERVARGINKEIYGDWKNSILNFKIEKKLLNIVNTPEVASAVNISFDYIEQFKKEEERKKIEKEISLFGMPLNQYRLKNPKLIKESLKSYEPYYPICEYSPIYKFDENSHPSYLKIGSEICKDILNHRELESSENIEFAEKFLNRFDSLNLGVI